VITPSRDDVALLASSIQWRILLRPRVASNEKAWRLEQTAIVARYTRKTRRSVDTCTWALGDDSGLVYEPFVECVASPIDSIDTELQQQTVARVIPKRRPRIRNLPMNLSAVFD
jgi:hypothetical protein